MIKKIFVVVFVLLKAVSGFNYSSFFEHDGSDRNGKFLFDSLFGFEEDLIVNDPTTNSLKSCDCGE
jgi:hypothetical protein